MGLVVGDLQRFAVEGEDEDPSSAGAGGEAGGGDVGDEDVDVAFEHDAGQVLVVPQPGLDQGVVVLEGLDDRLAVVFQGVGQGLGAALEVLGRLGRRCRARTA